MKGKVGLLFCVAMIGMMICGGAVLAREDHNVRFAVFSDPHLYSRSLGTTGSAFEAYLAQDRKLLRESEAILDSTIDSIIDEGVKFVLVPGDLTKDGELFNHYLFALKMKKFEKAGIQVFVVPGNHDINNPHAYRYQGDQAISIPNVSPQMFKWIYHFCGYGQALFRDPDSLSYVAEPVKGVWLIAMDSCNYANNEATGEPATDGKFSQATQDWILRMVKKGKEQGKLLIGMMHHGVLEHYTGQSLLFPDYVVDDWESVSSDFAKAELNVVFTGHYHANDITVRNLDIEGGGFIFDVETGSLVTYPNPYRIITLKRDHVMDVETDHVTKIHYNTKGVPFPEYSEAFLSQGLHGIIFYMLINPPYSLPKEDPNTELYAEQLVDAFKAHYAGDENPNIAPWASITSYLSSSNPIIYQIGQYLATLWTDLPPSDNAFKIDLTNGQTEK